MPQVWIPLVAQRSRWRLKPGTHWRQEDNSAPALKLLVREWLVAQLPGRSVLEVYGGGGRMFGGIWSRPEFACGTTMGEALDWLGSVSALDFDLYDIDPYGSPFEAIEIIARRSARNTIGIAGTDGALRRAAMMRSHISQFLIDRIGFDDADKRLKAAIYYRYPAYLRMVCERLMLGWMLKAIIVKHPAGTWKQATSYFALVAQRVLEQTA